MTVGELITALDRAFLDKDEEVAYFFVGHEYLHIMAAAAGKPASCRQIDIALELLTVMLRHNLEAGQNLALLALERAQRVIADQDVEAEAEAHVVSVH